jgi:hypothetical protein
MLMVESWPILSSSARGEVSRSDGGVGEKLFDKIFNIVNAVGKPLGKPPLTPPWKGGEKVGLPLGNLTSQLLVNIYLNKFDQFVKHQLKTKYYIRYADDFVILSNNQKYLEDLLPRLHTFLDEKLHLKLHENKVYIKTYGSGVDFLGWVHFPHHRQIRTATKRKIIRKMKGYPKKETINSYRGLLSHGDTYRLRNKMGLEG